jgi:hypothetical protein
MVEKADSPGAGESKVINLSEGGTKSLDLAPNPSGGQNPFQAAPAPQDAPAPAASTGDAASAGGSESES